ncbi:MAG TPA: maleylpyruvate isomerase N-terminal domain-containing protein, partial [Kribbella sp.]
MSLLEAATAQFERIVASIPLDHWDRPTPCDLVIREVVDHVVAGNVFAVRLLAGASTAAAIAG